MKHTHQVDEREKQQVAKGEGDDRDGLEAFVEAEDNRSARTSGDNPDDEGLRRMPVQSTNTSTTPR